jgi:hypothetical protein
LRGSFGSYGEARRHRTRKDKADDNTDYNIMQTMTQDIDKHKRRDDTKEQSQGDAIH